MASVRESSDFSLIVGGPLYHLLRRVRLLDPPLGLLPRRAVMLAAIAWLPMLVLAAIDGSLLPGKGYVPFLYDIEAHVRVLVALPLLFVAEVPVHRRLRHTIRQLTDRGVIRADQRAQLDAAVDQAHRLRNSPFSEAAVLFLVLTVGHWLWRSQIAYGGTSWYATADASGFSLTLPGWWYGFVAVPMFQFAALRWYMRLAIWFRLLLQISRLRLNLIPTHADHAAGLGFIGNSCYAFWALLLAHGALLSAWIADRVLNGNSSALDFAFQAIVLIGCLVAAVVVPLCVFAIPLMLARRRGRGEYGLLVAQHAQAFDRKWIHGERPTDEPMLGSADMSSLADLAASYEIVQGTRLVPFGLKLPIELAIITALPLLPLAFTVVSFRSMIMQGIKIVL